MRHLFRKKRTCQIARDRLKILLISDRISCTPEMMERIKHDIAKVISRYMKIDSEKMDIQICTKNAKGTRQTTPSLYANIPILETFPDAANEINSRVITKV